MTTSDDLKEGNKTALTGYVLAHGLATAWVILGLPVTLGGLAEVAKTEWTEAGVTILLSLLVTLLNRTGTRGLKASLIFWRRKNPEPGSRAFSELAAKDPRVDMGRLRQLLGLKWPEDPAEQNSVWYRLYQGQSKAPAVLSTHRDYLLCRDLTWLTVLLAIPCISMLSVTMHFRAAMVYSLCSLFFYLLGVLAARNSADAFVTTVLAQAAANHELPRSPLVMP